MVIAKSIAAESDSSQDQQGSRSSSYKPRRSSNLRFDSYGEVPCDEETLNHLEGKRSIGKSPQDIPIIVNHQDIELSTGTQLSQFCGTDQFEASRNHGFLATTGGSTHISNLLAWDRLSLPLQSSKGDYFSIPVNSPDDEVHPNITLPLSLEGHLSFKSPNTQGIQSLHSPFIPGELHVNKATRMVNSGFQVLPAFTFGMPSPPSEAKGKGVDRKERLVLDEDQKNPNKLQKKPRASMASTRDSTTLERA